MIKHHNYHLGTPMMSIVVENQVGEAKLSWWDRMIQWISRHI